MRIKTFLGYFFLTLCSIFAASLLMPAGIVHAASSGPHSWPLFLGLLNPFTLRSLHAAVERIPIPSSFLRRRLFGRTYQFQTAEIDIDLVMPRRGLAPFVHPTLPGKAATNTGFTMKSYTPPYVKPLRLITAADLFKRRPGLNIYNQSNDLNEVVAYLMGERLAASMDEIANLLEWMAAKAIFTGQYRIQGEGYDHVIDFGLPDDHNLTGARALSGTAKWNARTDGKSTGDPFGDIANACVKNSDDGQVVSDTVIMASDAYQAFKNNDNTLKFFTNLRDVNLGMIAPMPIEKNITQVGAMRDADVNVDIFVDTAKYPDTSGVLQPYVPAGCIFIGSTQATGNQELYAAIQDLQAGTFAQKVFAKSWEEEDPSAISILCQSAPLLALLEPKAGTVIKVI
jgi:hypothetical protein